MKSNELTYDIGFAAPLASLVSIIICSIDYFKNFTRFRNSH